MKSTWKPHEKQGRLTNRSDLPDSVFAFPKQRKEPMTNASHVRNAVARFDQVEDVSDAERASAFANLKQAAKHYGVELSETSWQELGSKPSTGLTKATRKKAATRGAATRKVRTKKTTKKAPKKTAKKAVKKAAKKVPKKAAKKAASKTSRARNNRPSAAA